MYAAIRSKGGPYGGGGIYSLYFIILLLLGNCKNLSYKLFSSEETNVFLMNFQRHNSKCIFGYCC